jgi:hypothetical protein
MLCCLVVSLGKIYSAEHNEKDFEILNPKDNPLFLKRGLGRIVTL